MNKENLKNTMDIKNLPFVSVIIPCFNEEKTIEFLLDALLNQTYQIDLMEIIIADGMSTDRTREVLKEFQLNHPEINLKIIDNPDRYIPHALNRAIKIAAGKIIVRMDAHSIPNAEYVEKSVSALVNEKADNVGGVWEIIASSEKIISIAIAEAASNPLGVGDAYYRFATEPRYVDTVPFGAYWKETLENLNGFNEEQLINEDYELNARIRKQGGKIWLNPEIRARYFARKDIPSLFKQYFNYGLWKFRMLKQYPDTLRVRQLIPPVFVLGIILLLITGVFYPIILGLLGCLLLIYFLVLFASGFVRSKENLGFGVHLLIPIAIFVMHFAWGFGFLVSMVKSTP